MTRLGLPGHEWRIYLGNLAANAVVASLGYLLFGGWRLFGRSFDDAPAEADVQEPFGPRHALTLALIAALIVAVVGFRVHVGMGALTMAILLTLSGLGFAARELPEPRQVRAGAPPRDEQQAVALDYRGHD